MTEWQPIETASKDDVIIAAYFYEGSESPYNLHKSYWSDEKWFAFTSNQEFGWEPTHWMPLPPPPSDSEVSK